MLGSRQGLIIWIQHVKHAKHLRRLGNIHFVSKRLKYVVLYVDMDLIEPTIRKARQLQFVTKVEKSYKPFLKTEFENATKTEFKEKEYEYKIGL